MDLRYRRLDDKWFVLTKDLHYKFTLGQIYDGHTPYLRNALSVTGLSADQPLVITAPKGFVCDLTSIPEGLQGLFKPDGPYAPAAALHDLLYQNTHKGTFSNTPIGRLNGLVDKFFADRMFLIAMRSLDISFITRTLFYDGVRLFGNDAYEDPNENAKYPVPTNLLYRLAEPYHFIRTDRQPGIPRDHTSIVGSHKHAHVHYPNIKRPFLNFNKEEELV